MMAASQWVTMSHDSDTGFQGGGWTKVEHRGARTPERKEPWRDDAEIVEPTHTRKAFENSDGVRIVHKERTTHSDKGGSLSELWIDIVDSRTEDILYTSAGMDMPSLKNETEKLMQLIDGVRRDT